MNGFKNINDANNVEYCVVMLEGVDKVLETMRIENQPLVDDKIQPIKPFAKYDSATNLKGFEALHNTVLDIDDQLLYFDVQTKTR